MGFAGEKPSERLVRRSNLDNHVADKMNFRTRFYKPALLGLAAILFCVVAQMQARLNVDRKELGLTKVDPLENAPPVLAFTTVALGSFRGLIANALWMRLSDFATGGQVFRDGATGRLDHQAPAAHGRGLAIPGLEHGLQYFGQVQGPRRPLALGQARHRIAAR